MSRAVVLLSGGVDSSTTLALAKSEGYETLALSFDYGQRHRKEIKAAEDIAKRFGVAEHRIVRLDLAGFGGSALLDKKMEVPSQRILEEIGQGIPTTYVPARNTIFLSLALSFAETRDADAIFIGANVLDYSGYPDCRPEFYEAFQRMADIGTKRGVEHRPIKILTPLINMTKAQIVKKGRDLGVPFELTWSCYKGADKACGVCDSCLLRLKGFREASIKDPIKYART